MYVGGMYACIYVYMDKCMYIYGIYIFFLYIYTYVHVSQTRASTLFLSPSGCLSLPPTPKHQIIKGLMTKRSKDDLLANHQRGWICFRISSVKKWHLTPQKKPYQRISQTKSWEFKSNKLSGVCHWFFEVSLESECDGSWDSWSIFSTRNGLDEGIFLADGVAKCWFSVILRLHQKKKGWKGRHNLPSIPKNHPYMAQDSSWPP